MWDLKWEFEPRSSWHVHDLWFWGTPHDDDNNNNHLTSPLEGSLLLYSTTSLNSCLVPWSRLVHWGILFFSPLHSSLTILHQFLQPDHNQHNVLYTNLLTFYVPECDYTPLSLLEWTAIVNSKSLCPVREAQQIFLLVSIFFWFEFALTLAKPPYFISDDSPISSHLYPLANHQAFSLILRVTYAFGSSCFSWQQPFAFVCFH